MPLIGARLPICAAADETKKSFVLAFEKTLAIVKRGEVCPQCIAEIRKRLQEFF